MNEASVASHTCTVGILLSSAKSRCLVPRHDKLKFFDEAEILLSAYNYSSACHSDAGGI